MRPDPSIDLVLLWLKESLADAAVAYILISGPRRATVGFIGGEFNVVGIGEAGDDESRLLAILAALAGRDVRDRVFHLVEMKGRRWILGVLTPPVVHRFVATFFPEEKFVDSNQRQPTSHSGTKTA